MVQQVLHVARLTGLGDLIGSMLIQRGSVVIWDDIGVSFRGGGLGLGGDLGFRVTRFQVELFIY